MGEDVLEALLFHLMCTQETDRGRVEKPADREVVLGETPIIKTNSVFQSIE
jgi:hypothetical protein